MGWAGSREWEADRGKLAGGPCASGADRDASWEEGACGQLVPRGELVADNGGCLRDVPLQNFIKKRFIK